MTATTDTGALAVRAMDLVAAAKQRVQNLTPAEVAEETGSADVLLVDVREEGETAGGIIDGAVLAPRGMLEFYADPTTPYHMEVFAPQRRVILYCSAGSRSALAAQTLRDLGYHDVAHLDGGFKGWVAEGRSVIAPPSR